MDRTGVKAAIDEVVKGGALTVKPETEEMEQIDLFDDFDVKEVGFDPFAFAKKVRKAGRPKGAQNKSTLANKEYCLKRGYGCALDLLAVEAHMDPKEVQRRFGCSIEAAMAWVKDFRMEYAEYTEKKMPRAVELDSDGPVSLAVINFQAPDLSKAETVEAEFKVVDNDSGLLRCARNDEEEKKSNDDKRGVK